MRRHSERPARWLPLALCGALLVAASSVHADEPSTEGPNVSAEPAEAEPDNGDGDASADTAEPSGFDTEQLPTHYAQLFVPDASWSYNLTGGTRAACAVDATRTFARGVATVIRCDGPNADVDGIYTATAEGMWRLPVDDIAGLGHADIAVLTDHPQLISAAPEQRTYETSYGCMIRNTREGIAWCVTEVCHGASFESPTWRYCFDGAIYSSLEADVLAVRAQ